MKKEGIPNRSEWYGAKFAIKSQNISPQKLQNSLSGLFP